jgi:hypothetical protein
MDDTWVKIPPIRTIDGRPVNRKQAAARPMKKEMNVT